MHENYSKVNYKLRTKRLLYLRNKRRKFILSKQPFCLKTQRNNELKKTTEEKYIFKCHKLGNDAQENYPYIKSRGKPFKMAYLAEKCEICITFNIEKLGPVFLGKVSVNLPSTNMNIHGTISLK